VTSSVSSDGRHVLFLGDGLGEVSWRFRVAQYLPHLRRAGLQVDVADLHRPLAQRLRVLGNARHYDVVCVHRALLSPIERAWLRRAAPRYVFDFDDAIMFRDSAARRFASRRRLRRFARMAGGAGAVVAGNGYLADWARRYQDRVVVVPTAVDLPEYEVPPRAGAAPAPVPTIGWIGTRINLMYLRTVLPALERLAQRRPQLRLAVVSDGTLEGAALPVSNKAWSRGEEARDLSSFDVGIMPLPDDPWTRGKCAVKILQYYAAGVPVVCSPVGANLEVVEDGASGYFARTADEWIARLDTLLGDASLRQRFAARGRAVVAERYSVAVTLPRLLEVLHSTRSDAVLGSQSSQSNR
jgi:glycosyltransferase involved in cell wall biosynthesis